METAKNLLTTNRKALTINLDPAMYGTFAEIGAGQEVARHFFQAGGAAGTIAKTMSAYDMKFSDAIYGKARRYVSRERLHSMLDHEFVLLLERLQEQRGDSTRFFVFADTVSAKSFRGANEWHGWMGVRFQTKPNSPPNDVVIHVRMWDKDNVLQQQALGIVGVNLIYGAAYYHSDAAQLVDSLLDNVGSERVEVDMIALHGPDFAGVDNRLMALRLVQQGHTNAVMFGPDGSVLQPSEFLYRKPIIVERGSFRPVTHVNVDMLQCACAQFVQEQDVKEKEVVVLMEITMHNLLSTGELDATDFLGRVDTLATLGNCVLISNYSEFYRLVSYFRRYTRERIGLVLGINNLLEVFNEKYYEDLEGGILESFGRLFRNAVKLYVYPMRRDAYERYLAQAHPAPAGSAAPAAENGSDATKFARQVLITARNLQVPHNLANLYAHLLENRYIECIFGYDERWFGVLSRDVLARIKACDSSWADLVPAPVARVIRERRLFGFNPDCAPAPDTPGSPAPASSSATSAA